MDNKYHIALGIKEGDDCCPTCKSKNIRLTEKQTRGSDEPLTLLIFCKDCKKTTNITN